MDSFERRIDLTEKQRQYRQSLLAKRPKLHPDTAHEYLDWVISSMPAFEAEDVERFFRAAELLVRVRMGDAQDKATQHTLVQDGTIAPPPAAA